MNRQPKSYEVISHHGFDLHLPDDLYVEYIFMHLLATFIFFGKMSIQVLCPFCKLDYLAFWLLSCKSSSYILDINSLSDMWFANVSPIL